MKTIWTKLPPKINSLSIRERKLIALTSISFVLAMFVLFAWHPIWNKYQNIMHENAKMIINIDTSQDNIEALESRSKEDVNLPYRSKLSDLKEIEAIQQETINSITGALIQPEKMNLVFEGLLDKNKLMFDSMKNLKPKVIELKQAKESNQVLYEHGLVLEMRGQYFHGLEYIKAIENQDWQLYWDEVEYRATRYPQGELTLKVHTLSTSDKVLGL
ncbi:hypothetical protein ACU6U9_05290 [Pseudomonas sp. HK3]